MVKKKNRTTYVVDPLLSNSQTNWRIPQPCNANHSQNKKNIKKQEHQAEKSNTISWRSKNNCNLAPDSSFKQAIPNDHLHGQSSQVTTTLTAEQMRILNEETVSTSNPLKAVMGYTPQDDLKICKFAVNGECFKKSRCRLSHEQKLPSGWTRDQCDVIISIRNEPVHPGVDTRFRVIPTYIKPNGCEFYGQILSPDLKIFLNLMEEINQPAEISTLKSYPKNVAPTLAELVLAKYTDGLFYRARITHYDEESESVIVFFLDYGNTEMVPLDDIRKWENKLEIVSFQSHEFRIAGVKCRPKQGDILRKFLEQLLLDVIFNATVIDVFDSTYVSLIDGNQLDIATVLKDYGFCDQTDSIPKQQPDSRSFSILMPG